MLRTRVLTAVVGIPLALVVVFAPGGGLMAFALSLLALLGALEYRRAYLHADWIPQPRPSLILLLAGACLPLLVWRFPQASLASVLLPALAVAALYELARAWEGRRLSLAANLGHGVFGMLYIGWLFSFGVLLRADYAPAPLWGWQVERGALWVLWLLAMLWLGDSGAYFVGRAIGRRKLAPTLSPAKTVEGSLANLALCVLVGWQGGVALGLPLGWAIAGGLGVGILGQLGDLFESALKRAVGVKDFGGILPGHGGVLDRFDSFLFSAPWVWWIVQNAVYRS
jgi:phosphatidate cytidylyltransferase